MGIYFRYILLIIISRGTSNCVQHVFEKKKVYFIMLFPPILNSYSPMKAFCDLKKKKIKRTKHIYFHSLFSSYLPRILTILTTCVYSNKIYNLCIMTMYLEFELTTFLSGLLVLRISQLLSSSCLLD